jgi:hypothetical protein
VSRIQDQTNLVLNPSFEEGEYDSDHLYFNVFFLKINSSSINCSSYLGFVHSTINKMKNKQNICHTGGLIQKSNINIVERCNIDNHKHERQSLHD